MKVPINDTTQQKARDLARQITVAHDLDPEIQEELYGHIEDKLLAYKSGEERVSDEDAFILVREHFGDEKVVRGLLRAVHSAAVQLSLVRRFLAIMVAMLSYYIAHDLVRALTIASVAQWYEPTGMFSEPPYYWRLSNWDAPILIGILWLVLRRWDGSIRHGKSTWFSRISMMNLILLVVFLAIVHWSIPTVHLSLGSDLWQANNASRIYDYAALLAWFALCLVWLWWFRRTPGRPWSLVAAAGAWIVFALGIHLYPAHPFVVLGHELTPWHGVPLVQDGRIGSVHASVYLNVVWPDLTSTAIVRGLKFHIGCVLVCGGILSLLGRSSFKNLGTTDC